ncbi:MAG TPA: hypothetical protein PKD18_04595 [Saprospiraceae bacterium]|nr:hypothetical protein [Saprospiraceae bacterium]
MTSSNMNNSQNTYASSITEVIEKTLSLLNYDAEKCKKAQNVWELSHESATIEIVFHRKKGIIYGDALLAALPTKDRKMLYEYLLRQNLHIQGLTMSIKDNKVLISFMTTDQDLTVDHLKKLISKLLIEANKFDNILVEQYGAFWPDQKQ